MPDLSEKLAGAKVVRLTMLESTLVLSGKSVAERGPTAGLVDGFVIVPAPTAPRQAVSILDFERDMCALKDTSDAR